MSKLRMASGQGSRPARVAGRLALLISRFGHRLYQADDARARQHGWEITVQRGGLARRYRDPRFDRFRECPGCRGTGKCSDDQRCGSCAGTGRITVTALSDPGRRP
jgi:hypothetical protein